MHERNHIMNTVLKLMIIKLTKRWKQLWNTKINILQVKEFFMD